MIAFIFILTKMENVDAMQTSKLEQQEKSQILLRQGTKNLVELYEEQKFIMGDEWFDSKGNLVPSEVLDVKYIETSTYISSKGEKYNKTSERVLTKEEYANWTPKNTRSACADEPFGAADCWETTAKRIFIMYQTSPSERVVVINQWKTMPSVRSYDTIGLLYDNFNMTSAWGYQWYNTSSNTEPQTIN